VTETAGPAAPSVRFYLPSPPLAALVTTFYMIDVTQPMVDHIHPEWGNIRLVVKGLWTSRFIGGAVDSPGLAVLYGPTDRTRQIDSPGGALVGIGLTPLGWLKLIGSNADALANRVVRLDELLGVPDATVLARLAPASDAERVALLESLLLARLDARSTDDDAVRAVHQALIAKDVTDVAGLAAASGLHVRQLQRVCGRAFGFSPRRLLNRQRFMRTLKNVTEQLDRPVGAVLDEAYYDQAQFIRDFRSYMGMTPSAYFKLPRVLLQRSAAERRRLVGEHFQLLHPAAP